MRLRALLDRAEVLDVHGDPDVDVRAVVHDSRTAGPGALFCCIPGGRTDGHAHAADAVEAGATALLVERVLPLPAVQVRVPSVRSAVGPIAAAFHADPSHAVPVVGVTGTNGKTTTTYLLEAIARAAGLVPGVVGTVETRIGDAALPQARTTPEATELQALLARMRDAGAGVVAMEVSSHALAMRRVRGTRFAVAAFTNLGLDHLDFHGSVDDYFAAKAALFTPEYTARAAVHADDPYGARLTVAAREAGIDVWTFGMAGAGHDVTAHDVVLGGDGARFTLVERRAGRRAAIRSPLVGAFNVENALAAAASALALGLPWEAVVEGLHREVVVPGRMERFSGRDGVTVVVDYAHTPDALDRVLGAARALTGPAGRVLCVFGAGGDRDRDKRPAMGAAVARHADVAIVTTDNPRSEEPAAIAAAVEVGMAGAQGTVLRELDRRAAIRTAIGAARPGDVVVVAGKGHETGQEAAGRVTPFDDREEVRRALEVTGCD